ncbi:hypothetical protein ALIPUT_01464 [Alistipes putredinis DSM 17216]|uniref:Uncharacterized protein n=1 Tax=Alistipes putredinis DSM 17216 TaxID=445970 RepID=B0MWF8_9BACT|nr:hypothetical protein ALIPUT_01464 [Alistipes putredinis DSM 17216]
MTNGAIASLIYVKYYSFTGNDLVTKQRPLSAFFVLKLTDYRF